MNLLLLWIFVFFLCFFVNGPQAQYGNLGCLKCISGIYLYPANKRFMYYFIHFISYIKLLIPLKKEDLLKEFSLKVPLFLLNNLLYFCSLINFDALLTRTDIFIKALFFRYLPLQFLEFYFLYIFSTSRII